MTFNEIKATANSVARSSVEAITGKKPQQFRHFKKLLVAFCVVVFLVGSFFAYRLYVGYRERSAQKMWAEQFVEFHQAQESGMLQDWEHVAIQLKLAYERNKSAHTSAYMLAFQAEALAKQGKLNDAIDTLSTMLERLSPKSPVYALFKIKRALLKLDTDSDELQQAGLQELIAAARNKETLFYDMALYYLGRYYWAQGDIAQTKQVWQELVDGQWQEKISPSPWGEVAQQKLRQIPE